MQEKKKAALLLYPMFSNYEMALTLATLQLFEKEVVTFAIDKTPLQSEEGLTVLADKPLDLQQRYRLLKIASSANHTFPATSESVA